MPITTWSQLGSGFTLISSTNNINLTNLYNSEKLAELYLSLLQTTPDYTELLLTIMPSLLMMTLFLSFILTLFLSLVRRLSKI